ncbi:MAG: thioesterase [Leptospirales bacterium]|nr:thioesterase [Leptospirales bacterium]
MSINLNVFDNGSLIEKKFTIPAYELDMNYSTTMPVICNYLYDIGMEHAAIVLKDIDSTDALPEDVVFVVTRYQVRIERYPLLKENVLIRTWLSPIEGKHVVRNFLLMDESGEIFGRAINSATTFNLKKRAGEDISDRFNNSKFKTLHLEPALPHVFEKLPNVVSPDYENEVDVRYFDCDFYLHVNNVKYVEWCIETMPIEFLKKHRLYEIDINFKKESSPGEKLIVKTCSESVKTCSESKENTFIHLIASEDGTRDIVRMRSVWRPTHS